MVWDDIEESLACPSDLAGTRYRYLPKTKRFLHWVYAFALRLVVVHGIRAAGTALAGVHPLTCHEHSLGRPWRQSLALA